MRKILFLSSSSPTNIGGTRRLWYNLKHFSERFEVHFIKAETGMPEGGRQLPLPRGVAAVSFRAKGAFADPLAMLTPLTALHRMKLRSLRREVQEYVDRNGIDAVATFTQDCSFAFRDVRAGAKVCELLDSHGFYYSSKREASGGLLQKAFCTLLEAFSRALEREYGRAYDLAIYVSELDRARSEIPIARTRVFQDVRDPPLKRPNLGKRGTDVVMFGRWQHPPNRDGLARVLAGLGKIRGTVRVIGPGFDARGCAVPPNVEVEGYVDDIAGAISHSKVCLIPVWYGAGLQNKVFDALRFGCVVVTTDFTGTEFSANGMASESVVASGDLVAATNAALAKWSPKDAAAAYRSYRRLYLKSLADEEKYVRCVEELCQRNSSP